MVFSCCRKNIVTFCNKEGAEIIQIGQDKTGSRTLDTLYIKEDNNVAVSSGFGAKRCITIMDIERKKVITTISMDTNICGMANSGRTIYYCGWSKGLKMLNLSDKSSVSRVRDPVLSCPIWIISTPSLLQNVTMFFLQQENTILPSGSKEHHPLIASPLMFTFCFRFRCILSTDIGGGSATIIWACLFFFLTKVNSQGFDSTTTSPKL
jgi:hypothetical protein